MTQAQLRHKDYYYARRKPDPNLQSGDMVWLLPRNIQTTRPCKKLDYKKIGPFQILAKIGSNTYKLELPPIIKIHNTFHISLLEPYNDDKLSSQSKQPPPPIIIEEEPEYELEEIIDSRLHYGKLQYRAKWTGYSPEHDKAWYPHENFENADLAKQQFHQRYPHKPDQNQNHQTAQWRALGTSHPSANDQPVSKPLPIKGNHTNQPRIFSGQPTSSNHGHQSQVPRCRNELDGLLRGRVLGAQSGQRRGILPASP